MHIFTAIYKVALENWSFASCVENTKQGIIMIKAMAHDQYKIVYKIWNVTFLYCTCIYFYNISCCKTIILYIIMITTGWDITGEN